MKQDTYKAAIYRGIGKVDVVDLPYPKCGDDDAIVKNLYGGICGADNLAYTKGGDPHRIWKDYEFGHEMLSVVVEVGKNVKDLKVGDHVFPNFGYAHRDRNRMATVGAFSEYIFIPQCEVGYSLFKIDKEIPPKIAVLLEPFVIGTRGALNVNPGPGRKVIVFGAGFIGMSAAIMLKYLGCEKVMIVDFSDFRLKNAEGFGIITCNPQKEDLKEKAIAEFGAHPGPAGGCGAHAYIDAIGIQPIIDNFQMLAGYGSTLAVVGVHHKPGTIDLMRLCYSQWEIRGCGSTPIEEAIPIILEMMKSGKYDLSSLVTHEYRLEQIEEALQMAGNVNEAQKVCISYV